MKWICTKCDKPCVLELSDVKDYNPQLCPFFDQNGQNYDWVEWNEFHEQPPKDAQHSEPKDKGSEGSDARHIGCSTCKHCDGNMKKNCMLCITTDSLKGYEPNKTTPKVQPEVVGEDKEVSV